MLCYSAGMNARQKHYTASVQGVRIHLGHDIGLTMDAARRASVKDEKRAYKVFSHSGFDTPNPLASFRRGRVEWIAADSAEALRSALARKDVEAIKARRQFARDQLTGKAPRPYLDPETGEGNWYNRDGN